jgi:hypothetical protein
MSPRGPRAESSTGAPGTFVECQAVGCQQVGAARSRRWTCPGPFLGRDRALRRGHLFAAKFLVPKVGLEPTPPFGDRILSGDPKILRLCAYAIQNATAAKPQKEGICGQFAALGRPSRPDSGSHRDHFGSPMDANGTVGRRHGDHSVAFAHSEVSVAAQAAELVGKDVGDPAAPHPWPQYRSLRRSRQLRPVTAFQALRTASENARAWGSFSSW